MFQCVEESREEESTKIVTKISNGQVLEVFPVSTMVWFIVHFEHIVKYFIFRQISMIMTSKKGTG